MTYKDLENDIAWKEYELGSCADLIRNTCSPNEAIGEKYIGLEHIEQDTLRLNGFGLADCAISTKNRFKNGDILFGKLRTYFRKVVRPKFDGICSTDIWVIRAKEGFNQDFLYYWLASKEFIDIADQGSQGTKMPRAKWDFVSKIKRKMPSLNEQKDIACILNSFDEKIELNYQMSKTLEEIARTIFKSWFIDFEPVKTNAEETSQSFPLKVKKLFPESFVNTTLGLIPEGWKNCSVGDVLELAYGKSLKESVREPGNIPVYGSNGQVGWHNKCFVKGPGIVVGRKGNPGVIKWVDTDFFPIDTTFYVIPKNDNCLHYLYHALQFQHLSSLNSDSAVPGLNRNVAYKNLITIPDKKALDYFGSINKVLFEYIKELKSESKLLIDIRDTLLPKLVSGEIRVNGGD